ncbi:hypothetical protein HYH03_015565 [Edaphochlamys debaryana]|uniref:Peptidase M43 pregnancy-associated plasma-A domain-containing protein n=1 Tax=Edaphochlamys debaryana TaxID=47281 RepID=A0A836BQT8_9CHLO|nr:hypothetical protein HYH03_015565 [Edaphochlamys debaryana]|eukprot:KAG2485756.1 hypothetical protein HYH03_015565 [Edaphochlamys debaryana]
MDPASASSLQAHALQQQAAHVGGIAEALAAAAEGLSGGRRGSPLAALLPLLSPTALRLYVSRPGAAPTPLAAELLDLGRGLSGHLALPGCPYLVPQAMRELFAGVRDWLQEQHAQGAASPALEQAQARAQQPLPPATQGQAQVPSAQAQAQSAPDALPDPALLAAPGLRGELAAAVRAATRLQGTARSATALGVAAQASLRCHLEPEQMAGLVPRVAAVLADLHADLPVLEQIHGLVAAAHLERGGTSLGDHANGTEEDEGKQGAMHGDDEDEEEEEEEEEDADGSLSDGQRLAARAARRSLGTFQSSLPSGFTPAGPASKPAALVPLVFHIMLYKDNDTYGPALYDQALSYAQRAVRVLNTMAKPSNIQFFIKEVRNDPAAQPELVIDSRSQWLHAGDTDCGGAFCFLTNRSYTLSMVQDWPRSVNVFVSGEIGVSGSIIGYANSPGSDRYPYNGHVWITWDMLAAGGFNNLASYNYGPVTLLHEIFHLFGLKHPFGDTYDTCDDDDDVIDTPVQKGPITTSSFARAVSNYCLNLFWAKYGGDWEAAYARQASQIGMPEDDKIAWADSCPNASGYDEVGNYMGYSPPACFAAVGHLSEGQIELAHWVLSEMNPVIYAWGQYYALSSPSAPPAASPPPEAYTDICKQSTTRCACKASWFFNRLAADGTGSAQEGPYSYCDRIYSTNNTNYCEVDSATCSACTSSYCVLPCNSTAFQCGRPDMPSARYPPPTPPRPPSPPPNPPPPPPAFIPTDCKFSSSGCACRSSWEFNGQFYSYCSNPDGSSTLWCQVDASCAGYNATNDAKWWRNCRANLTLSYCGTAASVPAPCRSPISKPHALPALASALVPPALTFPSVSSAAAAPTATPSFTASSNASSALAPASASAFPRASPTRLFSSAAASHHLHCPASSFPCPSFRLFAPTSTPSDQHPTHLVATAHPPAPLLPGPALFPTSFPNLHTRPASRRFPPFPSYPSTATPLSPSRPDLNPSAGTEPPTPAHLHGLSAAHRCIAAAPTGPSPTPGNIAASNFANAGLPTSAAAGSLSRSSFSSAPKPHTTAPPARGTACQPHALTSLAPAGPALAPHPAAPHSPLPPPALSSFPSGGAAAQFSGSATVAADCSVLGGSGGGELAAAFRAEATGSMGVPASFLTISGMACGSVVIGYTVTFPAGTTAEQVAAAHSKAQALGASASPAFTSAWGPITQASASPITVYQAGSLCPPGAPASSLCPGPPPPPPAPTPPGSSPDDGGPNLGLIIGAAVGGAIGLLVLVVLVMAVYKHSRRQQPAHFRRPAANPAAVTPSPRAGDGAGALPFVSGASHRTLDTGDGGYPSPTRRARS